MKEKICPRCESESLSFEWWYPRLMKQYCRSCGWWGEPQVPEPKPIKTKKPSGHGFTYEAYDRYGYVTLYSCTYATKEEAVEALKHTLELGKTDEHCGPYKAVLWSNIIEGELYE